MYNFEHFERQLYLASSHLRTLEQYYGSSYSNAQRETLIKEFMHATTEAIDAMAITVDAIFLEQRKEIEELHAMVTASQKDTTPPAAVPAIITDVEISKDSLSKLKRDIAKALR